jgi:hypothetical protein
MSRRPQPPFGEATCSHCLARVEWVEYSGPLDGTGGGGVWEDSTGSPWCSDEVLRARGWEDWEITASSNEHYVPRT